MASQEVSKPVMMGVIAIAVLVIGFLGWWFLLRSPATSGTIPAAPPGMGGQGMPGMPGGAPGPAPR